MRSAVLLSALLLCACASAPVALPPQPLPIPADRRPDPRTTPGAADPAIKDENIDTTICVPGYTRDVRPPVRFTNALKRAQLPPGADLHAYEEDHLIPLEIGGAPDDVRNLWPEPYAEPWGARAKDRLENALHRLICAHTLDLGAAQRAIAKDWIADYRLYFTD